MIESINNKQGVPFGQYYIREFGQCCWFKYCLVDLLRRF